MRPDRYEAFLVTTEGSIFELSGPAALQADFERFACNGLPLPESLPADRRDWRHCPFVPENGYGEVRIDAKDLTEGLGQAP